MKVGANSPNFHPTISVVISLMVMVSVVVRMTVVAAIIVMAFVAMSVVRATAPVRMVMLMQPFDRSHPAKVTPLDANSVQHRQQCHPAIGKNTHPHVCDTE